MMQRILLLSTAQTYREQAFLAAAEQLGVAVSLVVDTPAALAHDCVGQLLIDFGDHAAALAAISALAAEQPLAAIIALDDSGSELAAAASARLGLPHNSSKAAEAARDKFVMRTLLARGGVPVPPFRLCSTHDDFAQLAREVAYPCVVKPLRLNGSRGVIRADDEAQFVAAAQRLGRLLNRVYGDTDPKPFLVERFIPGVEVALEGLLDAGELHVLALFDKPDPLDGPFFEETIYVTPSRLPQATQAALVACAKEAAAALGLRHGPMHGELRVNEHGPWVVEVAARSIGGQCSKTLRFGSDASLETLIIQQAVGGGVAGAQRAGGAGGVMMIPIPGTGLLKGVHGIEAAQSVPGIAAVEIAARLNYPLTPLPEGDSYLGFIFARGETPQAVEAALRQAHAALHFDIQPMMQLELAV